MTDEKKDEKKDNKLEECEKKKEEYLAGWQRARADFLNYKKEEKERMSQLLFFGLNGIILKVLPILDELERAEKETANQGIAQIKKECQKILNDFGVKEMKTVGEKFDPKFHEAVEEIETKDKESGIIIEEIQKGFLIQEQVLRSAKVKVSK